MITFSSPGCQLAVAVRRGRARERCRMIAFAGMALAACTGVLLAALDSPHVRDSPRLRRLSMVLLAASAATLTAAGADAVW